MSNPLFRTKALERLSSPDQLDALMLVAPPRRWIVWGGCALLMAMGIFWSFWGSVPTKVAGEGILIEQGALVVVVSLGRGQVQDIDVNIGDMVQPGQTLAVLAMPRLEHEIKEAQRVLAHVFQEREKVASFGDRMLTLRQNLTDRQSQALHEAIFLLEKQLQDVLGLEQAYEQLMKSGATSRLNYLEIKHQHNRLLQSITDKRVELTQLPAKQVADTWDKEKETIRVEQRVIQAEEKLHALLDQFELESKVVSSQAGRVQELLKHPGQVIDAGEALVKLYREEEESEISVLTYLPPQQGKRAKPGMTAFVTPSTVKEEEYGHLLGKIDYVSTFPASKESMLRELQNSKLVDSLSRQGPPLMVRVRLQPNPQAPSGLMWSSGLGPPISIDSGTLCKVDAVVRRQSPASLVLPWLKRNVLGVGDKDPAEAH